MKIRSGFVSNSSSSSFVFIAEKNEFEETLKEMHEMIQYMLNHSSDKSTKELFGKEVVFFQGVDSSEDPIYEIEGYVGEVIDSNNKVSFYMYDDDDLKNNYRHSPMYVGGCLEKVQKKMKEKGMDAIFNSEYT